MRFSALVLFAASVPAFAADWLRVRAPDLEILSDAGEKAARAALDRFEQIRSVLATSPNGQGRPLRIFLFGSEAEFRGYTDHASTQGFYRSATERDFIVLHSGIGLTRTVAHEYVHLVLEQGEAPLPLWFEEGTAELYSNLELRRNRMFVGGPIREHVAALGAAKWLTAAELTSTGRRSSIYNERSLAGVFYAESWALTHMIYFAPGWRERMPQFAESLARGDPDAFREAFGRTEEQALSELHGYLGRMAAASLEAVQVPVSAVNFEWISSGSAALACADLALHLERTALARRLVEAARRREPQSPDVEAGLGAVALAEGQTDEARARLDHAISMGSRDAGVYFQLAILERDAGAPAARIDSLLQRTITVDPGFGEAQLLLGLNAGEDNPGVAVVHLLAAARALPGKSYVWHALGYSQAKLGETGAARRSASRALATAATEEEERMAESLLNSLQ